MYTHSKNYSGIIIYYYHNFSLMLHTCFPGSKSHLQVVSFSSLAESLYRHSLLNSCSFMEQTQDYSSCRKTLVN